MRPVSGLCCVAAVLLSLFTTVAAQATNAPTNLVVTAVSNSQVNLTWTDNSTDEIGFTFMVDTNSAFTNPAYVWTGGANTTSYAHTLRGTATTYYYRIKAEGNPDSAWTATASATTTPAALAASAASSSQINLSWTGNSGNSSITGYTYAVATNSAFTGAAYRYVSGAGSTSAAETGLTAGTTYYFRIKAEGTSNAYDSPFTASVTATTSATAPNAPSGLSPTVVSNSRIDLTWVDNSSNETGFELKRATDSGFTQNVVWIGNIQGASYSNTGLNASTTYYYKVRAQGATQNSAYSAAVSATTSASGTIPTAPSNLTATSVSGSQINLSWTDNSSNETGFELKRATDSAFTQNVVWIGGIQGASYANTGLNASTTYYYKVRAEGTAGKSAYSSTANATTGTPPANSAPAHFYGINAWMPYTIGTERPEPYYGKLTTNPDDEIWRTIQASGAGIMRYGGRGVDKWANPLYQETMDQYVAMAEAMRAKGIEPVLQVPMFGKYSASQAADIVRHVNFINGVKAERAVTYWAIGNEPDLTGTASDVGYGGDGSSASDVATYLKAFASAMKAVDPDIKIMGPETAWYDTNIIGSDTVTGITTCPGPYDVTGADGNGNYYIDYISFHTYPFNGSPGQANRTNIINNLMSSGGFNDNLTDLKDRIADCNTYHNRSASPIRMAVTEANINYDGSSYVAGDDNIYGYWAKSFLGGQFWAEMMGIALNQGVDFMTFWSVVEGNGLSYLASDGVTKRPSYYHFQMMAKYFRGTPVSASESHANVKTFAAKDTDQIAVLIMNQNTSGSLDFTVRLTTDGSVSGTRPLKITVNAGVNVEYENSIEHQSSVMLVFNSSGTLTKRIVYELYGNADAGIAPSEY